MEYNPTNEQKLIDMLFEVAVLVHESPAIQKMSTEELVKWLFHNINGSGFILENIDGMFNLQEIK